MFSSPAADASFSHSTHTIFVALELSRHSWLVALHAPDAAKVELHRLPAGDGRAVLDLLARIRTRVERRTGVSPHVSCCYEAGRDGFWLHRLLEAHGATSHVMDPSSLQVDRRARRAKTDRLDAQALLRALMAWSRGEPKVCSMVRPPSPDEEDARRPSRERATLLQERIRLVNRINETQTQINIQGYVDLAGSWTPAHATFTSWMMVKHPTLFRDDAMHPDLIRERDNLARLSEGTLMEGLRIMFLRTGFLLPNPSR